MWRTGRGSCCREAGVRQLGKAGRIMRIGLVRLHRLQALVGLTRVDADDRDTKFAQPERNRRTHPARFDHSALNGTIALQHRGDRL